MNSIYLNSKEYLFILMNKYSNWKWINIQEIFIFMNKDFRNIMRMILNSISIDFKISRIDSKRF